MTSGKRSGRKSRVRHSRKPWVELPMWLLVLLVPLIVDPLGKDVFREVKLQAAQILALLSIVGLLWQLRESKRSSSARECMDLPALRIALLLLLAAGSSVLAKSTMRYSETALFELAIGAVCLVAWSLGWQSARLRLFLQALLIPSIIVATIGILQYHHLWKPFDFLSTGRVERIQITSLAGASSDLAAFLVLPILVVQAAIVRWKKVRWLLFATLGILGYALISAQSFTALIAAIVGSVFFWGLTLPRRTLVVRGGGILVLALVLILGVSPIRGRVLKLGRVLSEGEVNAALSGRLDAWRAAGAMWSESPILGIGHGGFRAEFGRKKLELTGQGEQFYRRHAYSNFSYAHNDYLQVVAEWGVIGFLALAAALFILLRATIRLSSATHEDRGNRHLALSGLLSLGVMPLTYFPWHIAITAYTHLIFVCWILALRREQELAEGQVDRHA